ncbi:MAG TPA: hypothetical protein VMZ33_00510 [Candidatus Limnocylindrales bacterium]|nr:hypothetical protein [Candidatus Limnocylindrales bacterium]
MPHPSLGFPPHDIFAGHPAAAARLRASRGRLTKIALQNALTDFPALADRYDEATLRLFLRDLNQHIEQLAKGLETGNEWFVTGYAEWLVPIFRRRRIPMRDFIAIVLGLKSATATVLTPEENEKADQLFELWVAQLKEHERLPGDHNGNPIVRFFWKGAGIGDDKWV